ncbi:Hypothetical predicted protein [Cloeon dipterum]|uniref:RRM domain-containing protein n=2 Tax=Cloeon dipterum TaxID=197152 RepID=A0A8S1BIZ1_9INSE|nr:Hypothetical predicted protein [Cloeon dipterum]
MDKRIGVRNYLPPPARQMISPERLKKLSSLVCINLPTQLMDRSTFRKHFSKYGRVTKFSVTPAKNSAHVHFETHEDAANAKQNAGRGFPDTFKIRWGEIQPRKSSIDLDKPHPSSEVQQELESMSQQGGYLTSQRGQAGPSKQARIDNFFQASPPTSSNPFSAKSTSQSPSPNLFGKTSLFPPKAQTGNPFQSNDKPPQLFQPPDKPKPLFGIPAKSIESRPAAPTPPTQQPTQKPQLSTENLGLLSTVRKAAHSDESKLVVLEARDKLCRLTMVKSSSLATAVKTIGTCPDMCPERERYLRIDRKQVSQYETRNGEPAHQFFVKEYSRSSADQELPLSHDLRPSPVLRITMNYLLSQIASRVEVPGEHLGEWFLFLWDRTRAIRKDVTQQELCNEDAVILLEQCARFHIACAARLADEDVHDFDPKINSENLAKCLQTLKHLYHDMSLKGMACPNEAEFRSYIVLLNLNTGDAIWEVQQLSPEVLASQPVQNAIKAYLSLSTHNYVNFFKVVRTIGYLPAAILMRYFTQVRSKGLEILMRALCQSIKASYPIPLNELVRILAFEDIADATEFCQHHGLETSSETVMFSRTTFMNPESNIALRRAKNVVESQLRVSFAEAIAGYPMAEFNREPSIPNSSFDANTGMLYPEVLKSIEEKATVPVPETSTITLSKGIFSGQSLFPQPGQSIFPTAPQKNVQKAVPTSPQSLFGLKPNVSKPLGIQTRANMQKMEFIASATYDSIVGKLVQNATREIVAKELKTFKANKVAQKVTIKLTQQIVDHFAKEICSSELAAAKEEEKARRLADLQLKQRELKRREAMAIQATRITKECISSVAEEEIRKMVSIELQRQKSLHIWTQNTSAKVLSETFQEMALRIASEELLHAQEQWRRKVDKLKTKLKQARACRMLLKWRDLVLVKKERRMRIEGFPAGRSSLSIAEQAQEFCVVSPDRPATFWTNKTRISFPKSRTIGTQSLPLVGIDSISSILNGHQRLAPFLVGNYKVTAGIWRMVLSVPSDDLELRTWAELCIARGRLSSQGGSTIYFSNDVIMRLELVIGLSSTDTEFNALALVVKDQTEAAARLEQILRDPPPVPVALLILGKQTLSPDLDLVMQRLCEAGALFDVKSFELPEEPDSFGEVQTAMEWLALQSKDSIDSYVATEASDLVLSVMQESFWQNTLFASGPKTEAQLNALQRNPALCIEIANSAVDFVASLISGVIKLHPEEESLIKNCCSKLPPYWNQNEFRQKTSKMLRQLKVPDLELDVESLHNASWPAILDGLSEFCFKLPLDPSQCSLLSSWLSHQVLSINSHCGKTVADLPWPKLIEDTTKEFISSLNLKDPFNSPRPTLVVAISKKQLESVMSFNWCNKQLLHKIDQCCMKQEKEMVETTEEVPVADEKSSLENLHGKLQLLLMGLAECKENRCRIDEKIQLSA